MIEDDVENGWKFPTKEQVTEGATRTYQNRLESISEFYKWYDKSYTGQVFQKGVPVFLHDGVLGVAVFLDPSGYANLKSLKGDKYSNGQDAIQINF